MSPSAVESFVREVVDRPQRFLDVEKKPSGVADHALKAAQELFEQAVKHQPRALGPLNALLVDGFDGDQIWEELQLRNAPVLSLVRGAVDNPNVRCGLARFLWLTRALQTLAALPDVTVEEEEDDEDVTMESDEEQEGSDLEEDDMEDDDEELEEGDEDDEDEEEEMDDDDDDDDESGPSRKSKKKSTDNFFDEDDMMAFIEEGEREMSAGRTLLNKERRPETFDDDMDAEDDEDEDDLDVDIYGDLESDDEVENTGYSDFFDGGKRKRRQEEDGDEDDEDEEFNEGEGFGNADEMDDDDEDDDEDDNGAGAESEDDMTEDFMSRRSRKDILAVHEEEESESAGMTRHELASRKAQQMMREMENENLEARPWLLGGEAGSRSRPENSLLEEDVDFDHARKEVPLVTEEVTKSLEDIIKRRIKDALWDDVERRVPTNADVEFKPRFELNDEKSKQSLSEVYERAYLEQTNQLKEDSPADKARQRLRGLVSALFVRLDALSNAHFVPKKVHLWLPVLLSLTNSFLASNRGPGGVQCAGARCRGDYACGVRRHHDAACARGDLRQALAATGRCVGAVAGGEEAPPRQRQGGPEARSRAYQEGRGARRKEQRWPRQQVQQGKGALGAQAGRARQPGHRRRLEQARRYDALHVVVRRVCKDPRVCPPARGAAQEGARRGCHAAQVVISFVALYSVCTMQFCERSDFSAESSICSTALHVQVCRSRQPEMKAVRSLLRASRAAPATAAQQEVLLAQHGALTAPLSEYEARRATCAARFPRDSLVVIPGNELLYRSGPALCVAYALYTVV